MRCVERWAPRLDFFPKALENTIAAIGSPGVTLYLPFFCVDNAYRSSAVRFVTTETVGVGNWNYTHFANPAPESAAAVFGTVMDAGLAQGMRNFEVDYLVDSFMHTAEFRQKAGAFDRFWLGLSVAEASRQVPVQFCMGLPCDALATLKLASVTSFRASIDYGVALPKDYDRELAGRWPIVAAGGARAGAVQGQLLVDAHAARGVQPGRAQPGTALSASHHERRRGCHLRRRRTNGSLVQRSTDARGRVLKSSQPLTPIDMPMVGAGHVWTTHSTISPAPQRRSTSAALTTWHAVAIGVKVGGFELTEADLWPRVASPPATGQATGLAWLAWPPGAGCQNGSVATDCVTIAQSASDLRVSLGAGVAHNGTIPHQLVQISEHFLAGVTLLGEPGKWVGCSAVRFPSIAVSPCGVTGFDVVGGAHEIVNVVLLTPGEAAARADRDDPGRVLIKQLDLGKTGRLWVDVSRLAGVACL